MKKWKRLGVQWLTPVIPAFCEAEMGDYRRSGVQDQSGQRGETLSLWKIQKISWMWWCVPVVPATQEAEAGELLELGRRRLQWAEITPLHSTLMTEWDSVSKKQTNHNNNNKNRPGTVAHAYNLITLGGWGRWIVWAQEFETSLGNTMKPRLY